MESVVIPNSVKILEQGAFRNCINLKSVSLSDNITNIKPNTFRSCAKLKEITVPYNLKSIEENAFAGCIVLETIYYKKTMAEWQKIDKLSECLTNTGNFTVSCTDGNLKKE